MSECRGPGWTRFADPRTVVGDHTHVFFGAQANDREPVVKYDGNGQPVRTDDPRLGNRAQRRAMAREARRLR